MQYKLRDVERVLRLSAATIRGLIDAGFVTPARGARRELLFSFQDLIVLRAARALIEAKIPRRRINRSLDDLRRKLPPSVPLSGLSIFAAGDRVAVRDGSAQWQADDGQYLLAFDVNVENGALRVIEQRNAVTQPSAADATPDWFMQAMELEERDPAKAMAAYEQAAEADACNVAAWINWGRLLHERGDLAAAERVYRKGIEECGNDAVLMFNFGVLLEDAGRSNEAIDAYQGAVEQDPTLADGHYNLARLFEAQGKQQHAIRHFAQYRRLLQG